MTVAPRAPTHHNARPLPVALVVRLALVLVLALAFGMAGCGTAAPADPAQPEGLNREPPPPGDAEAGRELFHNTLRLTGAPNCGSCHVVEPDIPAVVGPSLVGIAAAAAERQTGQSAEEYLYLSMVAPNDYIVSGYDAAIMPRTYALYLSREQFADLLAYLLTLEE